MSGGRGKLRPEDNPKPFSKDNPSPGRPPKVFSVIISEMKARGIERATPQAVVDVYEYLLSLPLREVIEIAGKPTDEENALPVIMRIAASELIGKRRAEILEKMLDRAHGKAMQKQQLTGAEGKDLIPNPLLSLPPEKQIEILKILNSQNAD